MVGHSDGDGAGGQRLVMGLNLDGDVGMIEVATDGAGGEVSDDGGAEGGAGSEGRQGRHGLRINI